MKIQYAGNTWVDDLTEYVGFRVVSEYYTLNRLNFYNHVLVFLYYDEKIRCMANLAAGVPLVLERPVHDAEILVKALEPVLISTMRGNSVIVKSTGLGTKIDTVGFPSALPAFDLYFEEEYGSSWPEPQIKYLEV